MARSPNDRLAPSSSVDDEGVRVLRKPSTARFGAEARWAIGIAAVVGVTVAISLWTSDREPHAAPPVASTPVPGRHAVPTPEAMPLIAPDVARHLVTPPSDQPIALPAPQGDPNDLASYFRPGDPVPSTANLIKAMNEAGFRTGIAAFNPPGTSPPLEGLAVPADFELPPGYVRHHQATDEGETIEPILMFSPDLVLRDAQGRPIPLPANRVVPPELAPPGLPVRWVRPGKS